VFGNYGLKKKSVPVIFEPPCIFLPNSLNSVFSSPSEDKSTASPKVSSAQNVIECFLFQCSLSSCFLKSFSNCLRLPPRLPVTPILFSIFPSTTYLRKQFLRNVWPNQLHDLLFRPIPLQHFDIKFLHIFYFLKSSLWSATHLLSLYWSTNCTSIMLTIYASTIKCSTFTTQFFRSFKYPPAAGSCVFVSFGPHCFEIERLPDLLSDSGRQQNSCFYTSLVSCYKENRNKS
jgi:hypothetical protein